MRINEEKQRKVTGDADTDAEDDQAEHQEDDRPAGRGGFLEIKIYIYDL